MNERRSRRSRERAAPYAPSSAALSAPELARLTRRLVRAAHPELIILFGSRIYGKPHPDSDPDVLVVTDRAKPHAARAAAEIRAAARPFPVTLDIHPRTPEELTHRLRMGDEFTQEIVGRGKQIYPARQKNGFSNQVRTALAQGRTNPMDNGELVSKSARRWTETCA